MDDHTNGHRWSDAECWSIAADYLTALIGTAPEDLAWDPAHHLQGHVHVCGCELVVIAPRDDEHEPVVLTAEDWDDVRRTSAEQRRALLRERAIADRTRLASVIAAGDGLRSLAA